VSTVVQFAPELSRWLTHGLDQRQAPAALVETMVAGGMQPWVARGIVATFAQARASGGPLPVDRVELPEDGAAYLREPARLGPGARIATSDRVVPVLARGESPTLALLGGLFDADECADLIDLARPRLRPSTIVDPRSGQDIVAEHRNSWGMFFRPDETPLLARLDRRLSEAMNLPAENGEGIQVLRYPTGAGSAPHFDFLVPSNAANQLSIARSGQRVSTTVIYLNDVEAGGETLFPRAGWTIAPQRGNAIYFEYCDSRGQVDHQSLHAGNPTVAGEKWVATKWMRQRRFVPL
jgi:prolyl 4-hydroxylase